MAEWVAGFNYEDIPDRIVEECKTQLMSVLGAMFAGSRTAAGNASVNAVRGWGSDGPCTMIPGGAKVHPHDALIGNSILSMALDYDDYLLAGHTGHSAVLVPLVLSEVMDLDGRDFILAQTIANEVEARIGASVLLGPMNGQMWGFIHAAGAACAAGRLLGLDAPQIASAIGLALAQPNRMTTNGFFGGDAKLLTAAFATVNGLAAAHMAASGLTATRNILEHDDGFCKTFSFTPLLPALDGLGSVWLSDTLSYKIYPGCAYLDAPLDCVFEILKKNPLRLEDVSRVDVHSNVMTQKMDELSLHYVRHTKTRPVTLNFYTPYNVAAAIADGKLGAEQFAPERVSDEKLWNFVKRVFVHHDVKYTAAVVDNMTNVMNLNQVVKNLSIGAVRDMLGNLGMASPLLWVGRGREIGEMLREGRKALQKFTGMETGEEEIPDSLLSPKTDEFQMAFGARVEIETRGGETLSYEQDVPFGAAGWNLEEKRLRVIRKFEKEAAGLISDEAANRAFECILSLDGLDNNGLRDLIAACSA